MLLVNSLYMFLEVRSLACLESTLITLMSHLLMETLFVSLQVVRSHTLIVTLITFQLLEAAVVFLLMMLLEVRFGLGPKFTLITVNIAPLVVLRLIMGLKTTL